MNTQDLKYFHELVKLKSYTKTAEKFAVSQPTITAAIKRLENKFGGKFLIRDQSHKSIIITKLGMQFDEHAQTILNEIKVAKEEINQAKSSEISFGLPPIIGRNYFPLLSSELLEQGILNHLDVVESGSSELSKMLKAGSINLTLLGLTNINFDPEIELHIIKKYPIQVIVGKNSPLAKKKVISFKDLTDQNFIGLSSDYIHTDALKKMMKKSKIHLNTIYRSPDVMVVKNLVSQNLGVSYLTTLSINPSDNIVTLPLVDKEQPEFILAAAKRKNYLMTAREEAFWKILIKSI